MNKKQPITLFFVDGMTPSEEELSRGVAVNARFRNARLDDGRAEQCDFVMGAVPATYKDVPRHPSEGQKTDDEDHSASDLTVAELKSALDEADIEYSNNAKKEELVALYEENGLGE